MHQMWKVLFAEESIDFCDVMSSVVNYVVRDYLYYSSRVVKHGSVRVRWIIKTAGGRYAPRTCRQ